MSKGSYAHVGLPGLKQLFGGAVMPERHYKLLNGGTLIVTEEGCLFEKASDEGVPLLTSAENVIVDVLALVDEKDATIKELEQANAVMKDALESIWSNSDDDGAIECSSAALDVIKMIGKLKAGDRVKIKDTGVEVVLIDIQYEHDRYQLKDVSGWLYGIHYLDALGEGDKE